MRGILFGAPMPKRAAIESWYRFHNPTQFAQRGFRLIHRDLERDIKLPKKEVSIFFSILQSEVMYPQGAQTHVELKAEFAALRRLAPGHFVALSQSLKAFNIVQPHLAGLRREDYQHCR